jgi:tetratricopeptide (TPR) repeat protein
MDVMIRACPAALAVLLLLLLAEPVAGQRGGRDAPPARPRLVQDADTNDANAYIRYATPLLKTHPRQAAAGFYWAIRLDPARPESLYGRRVALLMQDPQRLMRYMDGERNTVRSPYVRAADSLQLRALMMHPFMRRTHEFTMWNAFLDAIVQDVQATNHRADAGALRFALDSYMQGAGPLTRAFYAQAEGRYPEALAHYQTALRDSKNKAWIHAERAQIRFLTGNFPETVREILLALEEARKRDERNVVYLYDSKAMYEYSLGYVLETMGRLDEAEEAYGRALQEDMSYYPAYGRMALIAMQRADTVAAVSSLALAAAIESADAGTRLRYAQLLMATGDHAEAEQQLGRLIELEPYFAAPYLERAQALEVLGRVEEAVAAYSDYLARTWRNNPQRATVSQRIAALRAGGGAP